MPSATPTSFGLAGLGGSRIDPREEWEIAYHDLSDLQSMGMIVSGLEFITEEICDPVQLLPMMKELKVGIIGWKSFEVERETVPLC